MSDERRLRFAERLQRKILNELQGRSGFDGVFNSLDELTAERLRNDVTQIIYDMMEQEIP